MNLFSASAFGFIGDQFQPRGSSMTAIPIGQSGEYNWAGVTHITIPTQSGSSSYYMPFIAYTGTGTAMGTSRSSETYCYPNVNYVTFPITGTGIYSADVPWTRSYSGIDEVAVINRDGDYPLYASGTAILLKESMPCSSRLFLTVSNTGLSASFWLWSGGSISYSKTGAYTSHYSSCNVYYNQWTTTLTSIVVTGTHVTPNESGESAKEIAGVEYITGTVASSVVDLGSGINLYGLL